MEENQTDMTETDTLLRELNHKVNNNFQIVVSLMNLKKRLLPPERQDDLRFVEEHVQSMAAAYRLIYTKPTGLQVSAEDLVIDVVLGLRLIARLGADQVRVDLKLQNQVLSLDQAIALGLYLAVVLPPYLDHARIINGLINLTAGVDNNYLTLSVSADWTSSIELDFLRERLRGAYIAQLGAEKEMISANMHHKIGFVVQPIVVN